MGLLKFLSREKLVEYLDEELRIFLNDREIYEINQYGWLDDNRPDPDYLGLAMWQTEPPVSRQEISDPDGTGEKHAFRQAHIDRIIKNGRRFEELMKSTRHSIGLSHLYFNNPDEMSPCFAFHYADAGLKLTMASDHLRDLSIAAFTGLPGFAAGSESSARPPHDAAGQHPEFPRPFIQARDLLADNLDQNRDLFDCLAELPGLAKRIHHRRNSRSSANRPAGIDKLIDWYKLTVAAANKIFLAEYLLRNFAPTPQLGQIVEYR